MRWFHLFITIIYLSVLFSPPVKAVSASRVDVIGSGIASQQAIMPLCQHLASSSTEYNDTSDDLALCNKANLVSTSPYGGVSIVITTAPANVRTFAAQPRAPPSQN